MEAQMAKGNRRPSAEAKKSVLIHARITEELSEFIKDNLKEYQSVSEYINELLNYHKMTVNTPVSLANTSSNNVIQNDSEEIK